MPSLPAPGPSPCNPLPEPLPLPMPAPPPLPPRPVLAVPVGDMASAPPAAFGSPALVPGWLEMTTPFAPGVPPALRGGATEEPRSSGPPAPAPLLPLPRPERALSPPKPGGGGTTFAEPSSGPAVCVDRPEPLPLPMLAGGGTTCGVIGAAPDLASEPPPDAAGGGGTGFARRSPALELPQLLRSRLTCDGGGDTTAGAGNDNFGVDDTSRWGAETGGATTSTVWVVGRRELAKSRCSSRGGGAMTVCPVIGVASGLAVCIVSRETFGAGGMIGVLKVGEVRVLARETSGAGGTTLVVSAFGFRVADDFNSGAGCTTLGVVKNAGKVGAVRVGRRPSAGGGPGFALKASRLATAESECGRLTLGASTTFSLGLSPRATRMVWVRWRAC